MWGAKGEWRGVAFGRTRRRVETWGGELWAHLHHRLGCLEKKSTIHDSLHVSCWASEMATILAKRILATVGSPGSLSETLMPDQNLSNEDRSVCVRGEGWRCVSSQCWPGRSVYGPALFLLAWYFCICVIELCLIGSSPMDPINQWSPQWFFYHSQLPDMHLPRNVTTHCNKVDHNSCDWSVYLLSISGIYGADRGKSDWRLDAMLS